VRFVLPLLVLLALPGAAQAATVTTTGSSVAFQGDLGETNDATVSLSADGSQIDFKERATNLAAGPGCTEVQTGEVTCPVPSRVAVELGDNDDRFTIALGAATAPSIGVTGGDGTDLVAYTGTTSVSVSLDDTANDGPTGRGDNIQSDVENVTGTDVADTFTGSALPNLFSGGAGADTFACGDGTDIVDGDKADQINPDCEIVARNSRVNLTNGNDTFTPFRAGLRVYGRRGNDTLIGGPGVDTLLGDRGNDTIRVRGRGKDVVTCGPGRDKVRADRTDKVSKDCEKVSRK
jgi:Ca2+-binding RTX toxin-like protein